MPAEWNPSGYPDPCLPPAEECGHFWDPETSGQAWGGDARAVKGAVDDFFAGAADARAPEDLRDCPRQVVVSYRERGWNTWMVAK